MAYSEVYINNDLSKLKTLLDTLVTNGIVGALDYDTSGTYPIFKLYADAEKTTEVFRIEQVDGYNGAKKYHFKATAADGNYLDSTAVNTSYGSASALNGYWFKYGYAGENGVFVTMDGASGSGGDLGAPLLLFIITKNQAGAPVFVWIDCNNASNTITTNINTEYIVCSTDKAPLSTLSRTAPASRAQTVITPFISCPETGHVSYTPYAGRFIAGGLSALVTNPRLSEIILDRATWLTNGYWSLKVGDVS